VSGNLGDAEGKLGGLEAISETVRRTRAGQLTEVENRRVKTYLSRRTFQRLNLFHTGTRSGERTCTTSIPETSTFLAPDRPGCLAIWTGRDIGSVHGIRINDCSRDRPWS